MNDARAATAATIEIRDVSVRFGRNGHAIEAVSDVSLEREARRIRLRSSARRAAASRRCSTSSPAS